MVRGTNPLALRAGVARTRRSKMPLLSKAPPLSHVLRQAAIVDADRATASSSSSSSSRPRRRDDVEPRKRAVVTDKKRGFSTLASRFLRRAWQGGRLQSQHVRDALTNAVVSIYVTFPLAIVLYSQHKVYNKKHVLNTTYLLLFIIFYKYIYIRVPCIGVG